MTDGLNMARAMRVSELMTDFRNIQNYMASIRAHPSAEEYNEEGFQVLRRCVAESHRLLQQGFVTNVPSTAATKEGDEEAAKAQLQRVLIDASTKRFQSQKLYLQAQTALKWLAQRHKILLQGQQHGPPAPTLAQITYQLRQELSLVTDQRVEQLLRFNDQREGKWVAEDPSLNEILERICWLQWQ